MIPESLPSGEAWGTLGYLGSTWGVKVRSPIQYPWKEGRYQNSEEVQMEVVVSQVPESQEVCAGVGDSWTESLEGRHGTRQVAPKG